MAYAQIVKADGEEEAFDPLKLEESLKRAGATSLARKSIVDRIVRELKDGMTTSEIYRHAFEHLRKEEELPVAARYSIKRAVFDLGPSGFPFEQFVAEIFKAQGWSTQTGAALMGRCVSHEVDVFMKKGDTRAGVEVKFHNAPGTKTDVKDALYVYARFEDLKQAPDEDMRVDEGWLITNTRFTRNAIRYGQCTGLRLMGWTYPRDNGIMHLVERSGIHPLTCLTTLTDGEKRMLLSKNIVLCRALKQGRHVLEGYGIAPRNIAAIIEEAERLCSPIGS